MNEFLERVAPQAVSKLDLGRYRRPIPPQNGWLHLEHLRVEVVPEDSSVGQPDKFSIGIAYRDQVGYKLSVVSRADTLEIVGLGPTRNGKHSHSVPRGVQCPEVVATVLNDIITHPDAPWKRLTMGNPADVEGILDMAPNASQRMLLLGEIFFGMTGNERRDSFVREIKP